MPSISLSTINFENELDAFSTRIESFKGSNKSIIASSSFQSQSLPLLHMLSMLDMRVPIAFIDTGFLFPETYRYRDMLEEKFNLEIVNVKSNIEFIHQLNDKERFLFSSNPDKCCNLNKVVPFDSFLKDYDVWISGVRADQSSTRSRMQELQSNSSGLLRYHPMLKWTNKDIYLYRKKYNLPPHPLEDKGYLSVGCVPCTRRFIDSVGSERGGRWSGMNKDECGLHTDLAN
jgi:phosphoadenosine phosphosulfate reductase